MSRRGEILWIAGSDWWAHNRYSEHHFVQVYARMGYTVLFVNSISIGVPSQLSTGLLKRVIAKLWSVLRWMRRVEPGLYILSPILIPAWSSPALVRFNTLLLRLQLRIAMRITGLRRPHGVFSIPTAAVLVDQLPFRSITYYVKDRFSAYYESMAFTRVREHDSSLAARADVIVTPSFSMYEEYSAQRPSAYWVPHGVKEEFLRPVGGDEPSLLAAIPHPRIVYWGQVNSQIDEALLDTLSERHGEWQFVLVGTRTSGFPKLERRRNVHFFPQQPPGELLRIGAQADVLMNCRSDSAWNRATCPTKLREYLSTGQPVVSTPVGEIDRVFPGLVIQADEVDGWERAICDALSQGRAQRERRIAAVRGYTSDHAARRFLSVIESAEHGARHITTTDAG